MQSTFDDAVRAMGTGDYSKATELLQSLVEKNLTSPDVESNLGRSLIETGQIGRGILHLERAVFLDRFDGQRRSDLQFARSKVPGGEGRELSHPSEWGATLGSYLRSTEALSMATSFFLVLLGVQFFKRKIKAHQKWVISSGLLCVCSLILAAMALWGESIVIVTSDANLHSAPLSSSTTLMQLKSGARVRILRPAGEFTEVERPNLGRGWIESVRLASPKKS